MPDETKRCPLCGEQILGIAVKCRYCGSMLDRGTPEGTPDPSGAAASWWQMAGPLESGTVVREYRIKRMLGQGGMGEVYLADQTTTGRQVAMKVVAPELMRDEGVRRRFMEEARVMAALEHPNIVTLHTFFEEGGRFFLVMKYIDGESLEDRVEREGPLSVDDAVRVSKAVLLALEYAHSRPQAVIHRDIKPANILLSKDDSVVVMDLGIAKAVGREQLTRTAGIVGTYEYMSPEQIMGGEVGPVTDIYCFGITLYKMLTGVVPFPQQTDTGIDCMDGHRHNAVLPLVEFRDGLPDWLQSVVEKALAKDPAARFSSAAAMSAELVATPFQPTSSSPNPRSPPRSQTEHDIPPMEAAPLVREPLQNSDVVADFGLEDPIPFWRRRGGFLLLATAILLATNVATFFISRYLAPLPPATEAAVAVDDDLAKQEGKEIVKLIKEVNELRMETAKLEKAMTEKDKQLKQLQSQKPGPAAKVEPVAVPPKPSLRELNAHNDSNAVPVPAGSPLRGADTVDMQILEQPKLPKVAAKDELKCIPDDFPEHALDILEIQRHLCDAQAFVSDRVNSSTQLSIPQKHLWEALSQIDSELRGIPSSLCMKDYRKTKAELARYCTTMAMKYAQKKTPEDCKEAGKWAESAEVFQASTSAVSAALAPCKKENSAEL